MSTACGSLWQGWTQSRLTAPCGICYHTFTPPPKKLFKKRVDADRTWCLGTDNTRPGIKKSVTGTQGEVPSFWKWWERENKMHEEHSSQDELDHTPNRTQTDKVFGLAVTTEKQAIQGGCVITKELATGHRL